jgi:colanic acid biosynthesis glycosyl transferase WcaI
MELAERLDADAVRFFSWQPYERRALSICSADVHVVGLARGLAGYVVPSRLYGVLAAGRPVIAHTDPDSETGVLVAEAGCGIAIPPGDPVVLADALRRSHDGEYDLVEMGRRARAFAEAESGKSVARYRDVLEAVRRDGRS